ncbi:MAG: F0F1 ATP synthase subunit A [Bacteroidales bacterium]|nr:F0F1 ATP synthase subunit A [Bacteroidales bacterium]
MSLLLLIGGGRIANASETHQAEGEPFNAKELVLGHLSDSYEWHIMTTAKGKEIAIPLPIIVRSSTGWHCFTLRKLHEAGEYEGLYVATEGKYAGKIVEDLDGGQHRPLDLSLTKTACGILISSLILIVMFLFTARWYRRHDKYDYHPKGLAGILEWLINSLVENIIKPCVGENYLKFAPYLLTAFFFIFISNLLGLVPFFPGGANVTGNIAVTLVLAVATFLAVNLCGTKEYYKEIFWPEVPIFLKAFPLMPLIEFIGLFTKPFALMIRLFANIMAGHSIILSLSCIIFATAHLGAAMSGSMTFVAVLFMIFMNCLELLVAFLQAYVFTMLSSVFIGLAQVKGHHKQTENTNN